MNKKKEKLLKLDGRVNVYWNERNKTSSRFIQENSNERVPYCYFLGSVK